MKSLALGLLLALASLAIAQNPVPGVIPTLREWRGGVGQLELTPITTICVSKDELAALEPTVSVLQRDLKELLDIETPLRVSTPGPGDIYLRIVEPDQKIGTEGYRLETNEFVKISAATPTGVFYGTRSLVQMLILNGNRLVPRGAAIDWPDYAERGFMLDVARKFFSTSFLRRYVKFMGFYKMNDFQLHLSDNGFVGRDGDAAYSAFRLQSERNPGITARDGSYSRQDIRDLQDLADDYGVSITPEIEAPAHALALIKYRPELVSHKYAKDCLDLANPGTQQLIDDLWDEFIPWFRSDYVHIGADEYASDPAAHLDYKRYINETAAFVRSKGKKVRMWGGLTVGGGEGGVDRDIVMNLWYPGYQDPIAAAQAGYKLIDTQDGYLYIVPFAGYYYQHLNTQSLYEHWSPTDFGVGKTFPYKDPSILGGMFAVWNDMIGYPYTEDDVHELVLSAMPTVAEKLWSGPTDGKRAYAQFAADFAKLGTGPGVKFDPPPVVVQDGNLANGCSVKASANESGDFGAQTVVDSRPPTRWIVDAKEPQWLTVDLGTVKAIGRVILRWAPRQWAKKFRLSVSSDGQSWQEVYYSEIGTGGVQQIRFQPSNARFVKLELLAPGLERQFSLFEFEVYGGA